MMIGFVLFCLVGGLGGLGAVLERGAAGGRFSSRARPEPRRPPAPRTNEQRTAAARLASELHRCSRDRSEEARGGWSAADAERRRAARFWGGRRSGRRRSGSSWRAAERIASLPMGTTCLSPLRKKRSLRADGRQLKLAHARLAAEACVLFGGAGDECGDCALELETLGLLRRSVVWVVWVLWSLWVLWSFG